MHTCAVCPYSFTVQSFNYSPYRPAPARVGDEVPAGVTGAGGYYACGANVATEACGRERGREGGGEILTGE